MARNQPIIKLVIALSLAFSGLIIGVVGFMLLEEYNLREAFYMTVLTISTVGFKELRDFSPATQVFTSFFILFNLTTFAYLVSVFTTYFFDGKLKSIFKNYMTEQDLKKVKDHVIVCGFGRNGHKAYQELISCSETVVVIEANELLLTAQTERETDFKYIFGDATQDDILIKAGISRAKAIISALPKDADNVFVSLTARELNPDIRIIARASEKSTEKKLLRAGANSVVMPDEIGGTHMAKLVTRPEVIQFLDMMSGIGPTKLKLEEFFYHQLKPKWQNSLLSELNISDETGANLIGIKNAHNEFVIAPHNNCRIKEGDILIILGNHEQINVFSQLYTS